MNPSELSEITDLFDQMNYDTDYQDNREYIKEYKSDPLNGTNSAYDDVHNPKLSTVGYIKFLKDNLDEIVNLEHYENYKTRSETMTHIELSIQYLKDFNENLFQSIAELKDSVYLWHGTPLFEFILSFYQTVKYYKVSTVVADDRRQKLLQLFLKNNSDSELLTLESVALRDYYMTDRYTSMIVYDTSDLETVTDLISNSFHENSLPWKIRDIYIQESVLEKFIVILTSKLKPFEDCYHKDKIVTSTYDAAIEMAKRMGLQQITNDSDVNVMKPTIIIGPNRSYFDKDPNCIPLIMNLNVFRTVKESIDLINRNINLSLSVWTENLSIAYEFISKVNTNCIWINSNGIFSTKVPFPFQHLILNNIGQLHNTPLGIRAQEHNVEFQCFENNAGTNQQIYSANGNHCTITKTILVNSVKVEFEFDMSILKRPDDYDNFMSMGNYKTVVIPFGVTFGN